MIKKEIFTDEKVWVLEWQRQKQSLSRCKRCAYDDQTAGIVFDTQGICNYCHQHDQFAEQYPGGKIGERDFSIIVDKIKQGGKRKPYDIIVGVSGGCDSSYLITRNCGLCCRQS